MSAHRGKRELEGKVDSMATDSSSVHIVTVPLVLGLVLLTTFPPVGVSDDCDDCFIDAQSYYDSIQPCYDSGVCIDSNANGGDGSFSGDPHFIDALGTRYDFNGLPGKDYCLFTNPSVHVNTHIIGYSTSERRNFKLKSDGSKAVRTWIGKLGIMWKVGGKSHSLILSAREGPQVKRGPGFLAGAEMDSVALPALQEGETCALVGGGNLTFHHIRSWGHHNLKDSLDFMSDVYIVSLPGLLTIKVALRVGNRRWRTRSNAWTHIEVSLSQPVVHPSEADPNKMHDSDVSGQTFRMDRGSRSMDVDLKSLTSLLRRSVQQVTTSESDADFLDGSAADYETSRLLAADCRLSLYNHPEVEPDEGRYVE